MKKQVIIIKLKNERYAFDITKVHSIQMYSEPNKVPCKNNYTLGLIDIRGEVISVLDLMYLLNKDTHTVLSSSKIVILNKDDEKIGVLVDDVLDTAFVDDTIEIDVQKNTFANISDFIEEIIQHNECLVSVLSVEKIFEK